MNFELTDAAPEHKAGFAAPRENYDELRQTFEDFKTANDERLARIEHKRGDVLLEEKVDRINAALDAQQRRLDDILLRGGSAGDRWFTRLARSYRARAQECLRCLCARWRCRGAARARDQGDVGGFKSRWRTSGAAGARAHNRRAADGDLADPQHCLGARDFE